VLAIFDEAMREGFGALKSVTRDELRKRIVQRLLV
jgi:hypothetical protein